MSGLVALIDISVPIRPGMPVYDDDPDVHVERAESIAQGDSANITKLKLGAHTGTHVDAPLHFIDGAPAIEKLPLEALVGPALVVDATAAEGSIDAALLESLDIPPGTDRLLLKTNNSRLWDLDRFSHDFVCLDESGARVLVDRGVRLVGIEYLSIGDERAHEVLLGAAVVPLEGLDLRAVEPGSYRLYCLPLLILGSDGAPARALLEPL